MRIQLKLRLKEIYVLANLLLARICTIFIPKKELWLISERGFEARDNGYFFFRYIVEKHPEINVKFIISKKSPDIRKFSSVKEQIVDYGSFSHYLYLWRAKYLISTHIMGYAPIIDFMMSLDRRIGMFPSSKRVFLQHGIIKDNIPGLYGNQIKLDLFCCGGMPEYEYVHDNFNHPNGVVKYTGLCRYDNLIDIHTKKQILVMPTWRMYINKSRFEESDYYKNFTSLLMSERLHKILNQHNYELIFYPHFEIQPLIGSFNKLDLPSNVKIAGFEYDVQQLLIESKVLITDHSSVFFDMAYMRKPIIFYLFDEEKFFSSHYHRGYFSHTDIGDKFDNIEDVLNCLELTIENDCKMKEEHLNYVNSFFQYHDKHNCERVFDAIKEL